MLIDEASKPIKIFGLSQDLSSNPYLREESRKIAMRICPDCIPYFLKWQILKKEEREGLFTPSL